MPEEEREEECWSQVLEYESAEDPRGSGGSEREEEGMTMYKNECIRLKRELDALEAKMRTPLPEFKTCSNGRPIHISISGGYTIQLAVTDPSTLELTESILLQLLAGYHNYLEKAKIEDERKRVETTPDPGEVK